MMLPLTLDYGVAIDVRPEPDTGAKVTFRKGADWFWALRRDARGVCDAFISLPDEIVVALATVPASALKGSRFVDIVAGVEKPHETFTIFYRGGEATYRYGQTAWARSDKPNQPGGRSVPGQWLNLADSMGFVARLSRRTLPACCCPGPVCATFSICTTWKIPRMTSAS